MMVSPSVCGVCEGLERIKFKLSYNSSLLNVWTGNAAVLAGLTQSADNTLPPALGILLIIDYFLFRSFVLVIHRNNNYNSNILIILT